MFTTNTERRGPSFLDCWCNSCGWPSSILLLSPTTRLLPELCSQHSFSLLQSSYPHNKNLSINSKTTLGQQSFSSLIQSCLLGDERCHHTRVVEFDSSFIFFDRSAIDGWRRCCKWKNLKPPAPSECQSKATTKGRVNILSTKLHNRRKENLRKSNVVHLLSTEHRLPWKKREFKPRLSLLCTGFKQDFQVISSLLGASGIECVASFG